MSLLFVGAMTSKVKGTMLGSRIVEARFRRKGVELESSIGACKSLDYYSSRM
jgi:hypothetical protein